MTVDDFIRWRIRKVLKWDARYQCSRLQKEGKVELWDQSWAKDRMRVLEEEGWIEECYNFIISKPDFIVEESHRPYKDLELSSQAYHWAKYIKKDPYYEYCNY
jgi:hypothetical protein